MSVSVATWVGGARRRGRMAMAALATITTMGIVLGTPRSGEASSYIWNVDASGTWTTPGNWQYLAGTGPIGAGYPNGPGDIAFFTLTYTAARTVTVPAGVEITVGALHFSGVNNFTIAAGSPTSKLTFDNGSSNAEVTHIGAGGILALQIFVRLKGPFAVLAEQDRSIYFGTIQDDRIAQRIRKRGPGLMALTSSSVCEGSVTVENGTLLLTSTLPQSINCSLTVGDGSGPAGSAVVTIERPDQIADHVNVVVKSDGLLRCRSQDQIFDLDVTDGRVSIVDIDSRLTVRGLHMTGGLIETQINGQLRIFEGVTAIASAAGPATIRTAIGGSGTGSINLSDTTKTFVVNDGPGALDLDVGVPIGAIGNAGLTKAGTGTMRFFADVPNTYAGETFVHQGRLEVARTAIAIPGTLRVGTGVVGSGAATLSLLKSHTIADTSEVIVEATGTLLANHVQDTLGLLRIRNGGSVVIGDDNGVAGSLASALTIEGSDLRLRNGSFLDLTGPLTASSTATRSALITGIGTLFLQNGDHTFVVSDGPQAIDLRIDVPINDGIGTHGIIKQGAGVALFAGPSPYTGATQVVAGTLLVTNTLASSATTVNGGTLGGTGRVATLAVTAGKVAPGLSPGRLVSGSVTFAPNTVFAAELNGETPGTGYDQLDVRGTVTLGGATLSLAVGLAPSAAAFTIMLNDGTDAIAGTFAGLAEGATFAVDTRRFTITYRGGDGNDVVVTEVTPLSYFLAEGATGAFFDNDVLIANPNGADAPVTLTFLLEGGSTIVEHRTVPAQARLTVHVDQIAGLEATSASVQVTSDNRLPLIVERTMFWDASYYGGHTANAVAQPERRWIFAEGFQGFFDTYVLVANANAQATTATLTFLRENDTPFVTTVPIEPFARKTIYAGDYPDLAGRAFGIVVDATLPVIAERAMYFASLPGRLWSGGHVNTGIVAPATSWFHAEGATGGFFNTFILLSNPQTAAAHVELRFLLDTGEVITRTKTLEAQQRLTINPATEDDARLQSAAVSTVVQSDIPIVSERSMYWPELSPGGTVPFGEGHNSAGVVSTATRWGLAEGRIGGPHEFDTFILLANPSAQEAQVTITYLREGGAPIARTYAVPPTSRFNVDVKTVVPELRESSFGARIEVTNGVPIAVERSLYWNANGVFWAGGSNALATPLP